MRPQNEIVADFLPLSTAVSALPRFSRHLRPCTPSPAPAALRGWGLLEALIALAVLSLGLTALIRLQLQQHMDGRSATRRATAIHLISDLHNRMLFNRDAALAQSYALDWLQPTTNIQCGAAPCSATALAQADLHQWRAAVQSSLPGGQARIFYSPNHSRQVGVMVAWAHQDANPLPSGPVTCPKDTLCQLAYVEL